MASLVEVMLRYAGDKDAQAGVHFWNTSERRYDHVTYHDLVQRAFACGARLKEHASPGAVILIACHSPYATLVAFYGAISAGLVPMIFPMPRALGSHQALIERIEYWSSQFLKPCVLVLEEGLQEKFHEQIPATLEIVRLNESPLGTWQSQSQPESETRPQRGEVAFFQTTSSSTGDHKAVAISHGNILSNVSGIRAAAGMSESERMISWLPLFHDMGLVGAVLFSFCHGYPLYLMTPTQFIKRPVLWLRGMSEHACTITTAPNFGYDYCTRLVADKDINDLDLTAATHFFIGAEPIRVSTIREFCRRFGPAGVVPNKIRPAYGLAESTIITTISRPSRDARFVYLDPDSISINQPVKLLGEETIKNLSTSSEFDGESVAVCTAGVPIEEMEIRIVDESGVDVEGRGYAGEIVIKGNSVALGYVRGDLSEQMIESFTHQQVGTGDMGMIIDDELFIIERIKNIIIRNGENYLVSAMEQKLADLLTISHENVAVFESDIHDPSSQIVVLVEKHKGLTETDVEQFLASLPQENFPLDVVQFHRSRAIPRTTSGKKRHFYCRKLYLGGQLEPHQSLNVSPDRIAAARLLIAGD